MSQSKEGIDVIKEDKSLVHTPEIRPPEDTGMEGDTECKDISALKTHTEEQIILIRKPKIIQSLHYKVRQQLQAYIHPRLLAELNEWVEFENLTSAEITPKHIHELTAFIRYIFSNEWPEYVFCPECDPKSKHGKRLSIQEVFDIEGKQYVPLEIINDKKNIPCCNECGTTMQPFLDKEASVRTIAKKLKKNAWLTIMRDIRGEIVGANFAYKSNLKDVFDKEWEKVYSYADEKTRPKTTRKFDNFKRRISAAISDNDSSYKLSPGELLPDDEPFICANLIAIDPTFQGKGHFFNLAGNTFMMIDPNEYIGVYGAGESLPKTVAHKQFLKGGGLEVPGILVDEKVELTDDDYVIILYRIDGLFKAFCR